MLSVQKFSIKILFSDRTIIPHHIDNQNLIHKFNLNNSNFN